MADPQALLVATAAAQAVQTIGLPECQLNLAQAVVHMATAPKSNAVTTAIGAAMADVRAGRGGPVPAHLRDAHYPGARGLGHGRGYRYPHDDQRGVVTQQYVPDDLVEAEYYRPTDHGAERALADRVPKLRRIVRGLAAPAAATFRSSTAAHGDRVAEAREESGVPASPAVSPAGDPSEEGTGRAAGGAADDSEARSSATTTERPGAAAEDGTDTGSAPGEDGRGDDSGSAAGEERP